MVKRACKADPLTLPARKADTAFAYIRIKPVRQFRFDEIQDLRHRASFAQARWIDLLVRQTERDVARDRVVYEENILRHVTDRSLPQRHQRGCERLPIDQDLACRRMVQAE